MRLKQNLENALKNIQLIKKDTKTKDIQLTISEIEQQIEDSILLLNSYNTTTNFQLERFAWMRTLPIAIAIINKDGQMLFANHAIQSLFDVNSFTAMEDINLLQYPGLAEIGFVDAVKKAIKIKSSVIFETNYETIAGRNLFLRSVIVPIKNSENDITEVVLYTENITSHKNIEQKYNYSETIYRKIFESMPVGYIQISFENTAGSNSPEIVMINKSAFSLLGKGLKKVHYQNFNNIIPGIHQIVENLHKNTNETTKQLKHEVYIEAIDSHIELLVIKVDNANIVCFISDISKHKQNSQALQTNYNFLSSVIKAIPLPVFYQSINQNYMGCNDSFTLISGQTSEEIIDKTDFDIWPYKFARQMHKTNTEILRTKTKSQTEAEVPLANGGTINVLIQKSAYYNENGEVAGIIGTFTDITEHILTEAELNRGKQFFNNLLNHIPIPVYVKNSSMKWIFANQTFCDFFDVETNELNDKGEYLLFEKNETEKITNTEKKVFQNHKSITIEETVHLKNKNRKCLLFHLSTFNDLLNEKILVCAINDITQRKKIMHEINEAKKRAEKADKAKSQFLANMSHEIRTPMNAILGFTEIIKDKLKDRPELAGYINGIEVSGKNLIELINDILDLSKIEAGQFDIQREPVNIRTIVNEISQIFMIKINEKNLDFIYDIDDDIPPYIMSDETRLRQIFFNLVGNAIKFTMSGAVTVVIKKSDSNESGTKINLHFEVIDTGIGISKSQHERIFKPFMQKLGQRTSKYGGTGLGLAITKRLIELMGGEIQLESEENRGSKFKITLYNIPVAEQSKIKKIVSEKNNKNELPNHTNIAFDNVKILVVDDIISNRKIFHGYLAGFNGLKIFEAENGEEAINKCIEISPDIILMDMLMPVMDGFETIRIIKHSPEMKEYSKIPIVAMTGYTQKDHTNEILSASDDFLAKPIDKQSLLNVLYDHLKDKVIENAISPDKNTEQSRHNQTTFIDKIEEELNIFAKQNNANDAFITFKKNIYPLFIAIRKKHLISKIKQFSKEIIDFGQHYKLTNIEKYGNELKSKLSQFDIEEIINKIELFVPVVDKINNYIKN